MENIITNGKASQELCCKYIRSEFDENQIKIFSDRVGPTEMYYSLRYHITTYRRTCIVLFKKSLVLRAKIYFEQRPVLIQSFRPEDSVIFYERYHIKTTRWFLFSVCDAFDFNFERFFN